MKRFITILIMTLSMGSYGYSQVTIGLSGTTGCHSGSGCNNCDLALQPSAENFGADDCCTGYVFGCVDNANPEWDITCIGCGTYECIIDVPSSITIELEAFDADGIDGDFNYATIVIPLTVNTTTGVVTASSTSGTLTINGAANTIHTTSPIPWSINITGTLDVSLPDDPCSAADFPLQDPCTGGAIAYSNYSFADSCPTGSGNSNTGTVPSISCGIDGSDDLFYKVDIPVGSSGFTIDIDDWGGCSGVLCYTDLTMSLHGASGACTTSDLALNNPSGVTVSGSGGSHTAQCIDLTGVVLGFTTNNSPIVVNGLTGGETYYIRVSEEDDQGGWMDIGFQSNYENDNCIGAQPLTGTGCNYSASDADEPDVSSWTSAAHTGPGIQTCAGWSSNENMVWYYFDVTAATSQPIEIEVSNIDCDNTGGGTAQVGVFRNVTCAPAGGANSSNGLGGAVGMGCAVGTGLVTVTLPNASPLGRYYVVVDGNAGAQCTWEFESNEVLPVELDRFTGFERGNVNILEWGTASELNNSHFEIQRSSDPTKEFETIGEVEGNGTTTHPISYTFTDETPLTSGYYRLKQVDFDGEYELTEVIHILRKDEIFDLSSVYPNPTTDLINVKFVANEATKINLKVTDMLGKLMYTETINAEAGIQTKELDLSHLANGVYTLIMDNGETRKIDKIIKE